MGSTGKHLGYFLLQHLVTLMSVEKSPTLCLVFCTLTDMHNNRRMMTHVSQLDLLFYQLQQTKNKQIL